MKCVHCSASVEKRDWFCPNCKRSSRAPGPRRGRRGVAPIFAATALLCLALGAAAGMRFQQLGGQSPALVSGTDGEMPLVQVTTLERPSGSANTAVVLAGFSR